MRVLFGLLILTLVLIPLLATACEEEVTPPAEEEEEEGPPPAEEEEEEGNWWGAFGEPQYGGTITIRASTLENINIDPQSMGGTTYPLFCHDSLFAPPADLALDPSIHPLKGELIEPEYWRGWLAESWEQVDPLTVIVYLRQDVYWQDKPPVNGREFTADDVQYNYDRLLGTGSGFTEANPFYRGMIGNIAQATAIDKYKVQFEFKAPGAMTIYQVFFTAPMVAPEWVQQGDIQNWENAVGTGAWLLTDYVNGTSLTATKNPDYWEYDERHPQNRLPYADTVKILQIPDISATIAALRTAQIDMITEYRSGALTWQQAASITDTNPEIQQALLPNNGVSMDFRCDMAPFTDIRVRKALQLAIDLQTIAEIHYGGYVDGIPAGIIAPLNAGWCTPYDQWPDELKAEYSYDPEGARQLLAEAAADGVFEPNDLGGFDTNCVMPSTGDTELAQIIQSYFGDIGVNMEIIPMEFGAYRNYVNAGEHDQMVFNESGTAVVMGPERVLSMRFSEDIMHNYTRNNDSHYDELWGEFNAAASLDECKQICIEADMYALSQHWSVNVLPTCIPMVWQPWLKGYNGELVMLAGVPYFAARWWVDQDIKESFGQ